MEGERYCSHDRGKDWFGVEWQYEAKTGAPMPIPGQYLFEDIADWKKYVKFPDLDAIDWRKQAEEDLHTDLTATMSAGHRVPTKGGNPSLIPRNQASL